jgi:uncharacterized protein (DUF1778 family)
MANATQSHHHEAAAMAKTRVLPIRLTEADRRLIKAAADLEDRSLSSLARRSAVTEARRILASRPTSPAA